MRIFGPLNTIYLNSLVRESVTNFKPFIALTISNPKQITVKIRYNIFFYFTVLQNPSGFYLYILYHCLVANTFIHKAVQSLISVNLE